MSAFGQYRPTLFFNFLANLLKIVLAIDLSVTLKLFAYAVSIPINLCDTSSLTEAFDAVSYAKPRDGEHCTVGMQHLFDITLETRVEVKSLGR